MLTAGEALHDHSLMRLRGWPRSRVLEGYEEPLEIVTLVLVGGIVLFILFLKMTQNKRNRG